MDQFRTSPQSNFLTLRNATFIDITHPLRSLQNSEATQRLCNKLMTLNNVQK